jgi:hypothetical protein
MDWYDPDRMMRICGWVSVALLLLSQLIKVSGAPAFGEFIWWVGWGLVMAAALGAMARKRK